MSRYQGPAWKIGPAFTVVPAEPLPIVMTVRDQDDLQDALEAWDRLARIAKRQGRGIAVELRRE